VSEPSPRDVELLVAGALVASAPAEDSFSVGAGCSGSLPLAEVGWSHFTTVPSE
jgi:hypothetical protein